MLRLSRLPCSGLRRVAGPSAARRHHRVLCRAEEEPKQAEAKPKQVEAKSKEVEVKDRTGESAFSEAELSRLAALKQAKNSGDSEGGMVQGALSEVSLIDWPAPAKAAVETVYVLLIVVGASFFLFGLNGVFTEVAKKLY